MYKIPVASLPATFGKTRIHQPLNQVSYAWGHNNMILFVINVHMCFYIDSIAENRRPTDNEI